MNGLSLKLNCSGEQSFKLTLNCQIPDRGVTAIYGPSGSGKSTLLDCIAGLRHADTDSEICFRGQNWQNNTVQLHPWQRDIGYVFQDARLFPHLTVEANLQYAIDRAKGPLAVSREQVIDWLDLGKLLPRLPDSLSAGQQQRVAIARALLSAPQLLLLDEPLANLDHKAAQKTLGYLQTIARNLELPMLYVSHDIEEVAQLADHILLLEQGKLIDQGSTLELCSKLDSRLSHEEQAAAILVAKVKQQDLAFGLTELEIAGESLFVNHLDLPLGTQRRLRIPARDVSLCKLKPDDSSILNILPVRIAAIEVTNDTRVLLQLQLGEQFLLARITRKSVQQLKLSEGDTVFAQIKSVALLSEAGSGS